jgi:hypothetical protein
MNQAHDEDTLDPVPPEADRASHVIGLEIGDQLQCGLCPLPGVLLARVVIVSMIAFHRLSPHSWGMEETERGSAPLHAPMGGTHKAK